MEKEHITFLIEKVNIEEPDYQILSEAEKEYNNNKDDYVDFEDINWNLTLRDNIVSINK